MILGHLFSFQQLPLTEYSYRRDNKRPELTLLWSPSDEHPEETSQVITVFSPVRCVLAAGDEPLRWSVSVLSV